MDPGAFNYSTTELVLAGGGGNWGALGVSRSSRCLKFVDLPVRVQQLGGPGGILTGAAWVTWFCCWSAGFNTKTETNRTGQGGARWI